MKLWSEKQGLSELSKERERFRESIESGYEEKAKNCLTCDVQGICCTDEHFVNVQITRLDAEAIRHALSELPDELLEKVASRNEEACKNLESNPEATYSCPLFEPKLGCLVHKTAKPLACINHACYESPNDLPPDELLLNAESKITKINDRVYRSNWTWLPIPIWIEKIARKTSL